MSVDAATVTPGCVLSPVTEVVPKHCVWCGSPLPKGCRRWCSRACVDLFLVNHEWTTARSEAIQRASLLHESGAVLATFCDQCRRRCDVYTTSRRSVWRQRDLDSASEVNHVEPRVGAGYDKGCWNHQTNLQVLCHACHVAETARQGRERKVVGWPSADPHHTWRALSWSWPEAERFIETGEYPYRAAPPAEPGPGEPLPLWDAA